MSSPFWACVVSAWVAYVDFLQDDAICASVQIARFPHLLVETVPHDEFVFQSRGEFYFRMVDCAISFDRAQTATAYVTGAAIGNAPTDFATLIALISLSRIQLQNMRVCTDVRDILPQVVDDVP